LSCIPTPTDITSDKSLLAGLPFLPSASTQYRFLQSVPVKDGLDFQIAMGKRLVRLGQGKAGSPVNVGGFSVCLMSILVNFQ